MGTATFRGQGFKQRAGVSGERNRRRQLQKFHVSRGVHDSPAPPLRHQLSFVFRRIPSRSRTRPGRHLHHLSRGFAAARLGEGLPGHHTPFPIAKGPIVPWTGSPANWVRIARKAMVPATCGTRVRVWGQSSSQTTPQQPAHPQYANYWAPLTRKRHTMPHSAQSQHTNYWAPRTQKRHQQEHRPQRPTERSDPTQHAKGRTGDRPGPRKGATTRRNVTQGGHGDVRRIARSDLRWNCGAWGGDVLPPPEHPKTASP